MSNSGTFHIVHMGARPRADDDGGLFGGGGIFGNPFSSLPSDLSSVINLPGPTDSSTTDSAASTSVQATSVATPTISLTLSSSSISDTQTTSSSTTAADTSSSTASTSTLSSSSTSTSTSDTATAIPPLPTDTTSTALTPTPTSTPTPPPSLPASQTSSATSTSASSSTTAEAATAPKSFLQNKPLSVGVITASTLVGLVLVVILATWAVRKRRNDRLHQDILDFSSTDLTHESPDLEKIGGNGSTEGGSSSGSSFGHGGSVPPPVQPRPMYQDMNAGYPAMPVYTPQQLPSRNANPYGTQATYADRGYGAYQQPNGTYDNNWGYGYGNANPYPQAYGGAEDAYSGYAESQMNPGLMAGIGAGAQAAPANPPQRRPSGQRKPPPSLNIQSENHQPIAQAINPTSPISSVSLTNPPLQPALGLGNANPPARRTSLLNSPPAGSTEFSNGPGDGSHVKGLDPYAPKMPAALALPDEFGASPTSAEEPRRLVVRNE